MLEHVCLGVEATLQIGTAFVDAYCIHDWVLAADAALEFDGFHWRPSRKLGIALPPATVAPGAHRRGDVPSLPPPGVKPATATKRNHCDHLNLQIASGASGHRPDGQGVVHAFDQDRLSVTHREPA
jgi:hypothetical protein